MAERILTTVWYTNEVSTRRSIFTTLAVACLCSMTLISWSVHRARAEQPAPARSGVDPRARTWCEYVFGFNRRWGVMVGNRYRASSPLLTRPYLEAVMHGRDQYIALTPAEIRPDAVLQMAFFEQLYRFVASHPADPASKLAAAGMPFADAATTTAFSRLTRYQVEHCGLDPRPAD